MDTELGTQEILFSVPIDHACFAGHFPNDPLVPGALLLRWMVEQLAERKLIVTGIKQCKFLQIIKPGDQLRFMINAHQENLSANIFCAETLVAKATCLYHQQDITHE